MSCPAAAKSDKQCMATTDLSRGPVHGNYAVLKSFICIISIPAVYSHRGYAHQLTSGNYVVLVTHSFVHTRLRHLLLQPNTMAGTPDRTLRLLKPPLHLYQSPPTIKS